MRLTFAAVLAPLTFVVNAWAIPPQDPQSTVTLNIENDAVSGTDRYYTAGQRLGYTSPTGAVPAALAAVSRNVWGDGVQRLSVDLSQNIFTPADTQVKNPVASDRPYSAVLIANAAIISDTDFSRSILGAGLGISGPGAGGEEIQNGFHHLIGDTPNLGWSYQTHNEPIVQVFAERTWRVPVATLAASLPNGTLDVDVLPSLGAVVGSWRFAAQGGAVVRLGQGLDADFGASRLRPGITGGDAYVQTRPFVWYFFAGGDGQAVGYDTTLDGSFTTASRGVTKEPLVGEFEAGLTLMAYGVRVSALHVIQTKTFTHQQGSTFSFDGVAVSAKF